MLDNFEIDQIMYNQLTQIEPRAFWTPGHLGRTTGGTKGTSLQRSEGLEGPTKIAYNNVFKIMGTPQRLPMYRAKNSVLRPCLVVWGLRTVSCFAWLIIQPGWQHHLE